MARRATRRDEEWGDLTDLIRRVVAARSVRPDEVEDLVQETLVRVAGAEGHLEKDAVPAYAVVTARNVVATKYRRQDRDRRHVHRLVEYTTRGEPEELTLRREENDALAAALAQLSPAERELLVAHEVDGASLDALADLADTTPTAVAMRLSRARARLRLEFVLELRGIEQLDPACRDVLLALSAGDTRRQRALDAHRHIRVCPTCNQLAKPLAERRRAIAGWLPLAGIAAAWRALGRSIKSHLPQTAAVGTAVVAGAVVVAAAVAPSDHAARRSPVALSTTVHQAPVLSGNGASLLPIPPGGLAAYATDAVSASDITVLSVVPGEGAWMGTDPGNRVWVEFTAPSDTDARPGPVPAAVQVGAHVDFVGRLSDNPADYATELGFAPPDRASLEAAGFHVHVDPAAVVRRDR